MGAIIANVSIFAFVALCKLKIFIFIGGFLAGLVTDLEDREMIKVKDILPVSLGSRKAIHLLF